jgi:SIR2-like domain
VPILKPNDYMDFPISADDGGLTRTVIVRMNGAVDDPVVGYPWKNNFIITQDHYIEYLGHRPEEVMPGQILAKLRESSCLFLGYATVNSLHRVFLHWIWGERLGGGMHWAVERYPSMLEKQFCQRSGIALYKSSLTDYVMGLDKFLSDHREELA